MSILCKKLVVTMDNGEAWCIPIEVIINNRARHYMYKHSNYGSSLQHDTIPFFEEDADRIEDWAKNNMLWSELEPSAVRMPKADSYDYESGWRSAGVKICE